MSLRRRVDGERPPRAGGVGERRSAGSPSWEKAAGSSLTPWVSLQTLRGSGFKRCEAPAANAARLRLTTRVPLSLSSVCEQLQLRFHVNAVCFV